MQISEAETLGGVSLLHFPVDARSVSVRDDDGSGASFTFDPGPSTVVAAVDARTDALPGARLTLALDVARVCFFDADTGDVVRFTDGR